MTRVKITLQRSMTIVVLLRYDFRMKLIRLDGKDGFRAAKLT